MPRATIWDFFHAHAQHPEVPVHLERVGSASPYYMQVDIDTEDGKQLVKDLEDCDALRFRGWNKAIAAVEVIADHMKGNPDYKSLADELQDDWPDMSGTWDWNDYK